MKTRSWVRLFLSTLLIGGVSTLFFGLIIKWNEFAIHFDSTNVKGISTLFLWLIGTGFTFSAVSQMGFFAYLTVHRFGLGMFRSARLWNSVQILLMAFIVGDVLFFGGVSGKVDRSFVFDVTLILIIVAVGLVVARQKSKETRKEAFVPSLFFMVFVTIIEWLPAIRAGEQGWMLLMLLTLLVCNAYQLLILHRITAKNTPSKLKNAS